jgi:hypothetical protein
LSNLGDFTVANYLKVDILKLEWLSQIFISLSTLIFQMRNSRAFTLNERFAKPLGNDFPLTVIKTSFLDE